MTIAVIPIHDDFRAKVLEAVRILEAKGEKPSNRNVRREMGGGSPNWIAQVLRERPPAEEKAPLTDSPEFAAANLLFPGLIESIAKECASRHEAEIASLKEQLATAQTTISDQSEALDAISFEHQAVITEREQLKAELVQARDQSGHFKALEDALAQTHELINQKHEESAAKHLELSALMNVIHGEALKNLERIPGQINDVVAAKAQALHDAIAMSREESQKGTSETAVAIGHLMRRISRHDNTSALIWTHLQVKLNKII